MVFLLKYAAVVSGRRLEPGLPHGERLESSTFERMKALGFDGAEVFLWGLQPEEKGDTIKKLRELSRDYGLLIPDICGGPYVVDIGLPSSAEKALERGRMFLEIAQSIESPIILMPSSPGHCPERRDKVLATAAENLGKLDRFAQKAGVDIVLEPLNRNETNLLRTIGETVEFIEGLGTERVRLMADLYHLNNVEASIPFALRRAVELLAHIHVSENHGGLPGTGTIPYAEVFRTLKAIGYKGFLSIEFHGYEGELMEGNRKALSYLKLLEQLL